MGFVPIMWAVWGVSFVFMAGVSVFAARVGRNEEDQLFLSDSSSHVQSEQSTIAEKLSKVRPLKQMSLGILGVMTLFVAGYYVLDVLRQFGK